MGVDNPRLRPTEKVNYVKTAGKILAGVGAIAGAVLMATNFHDVLSITPATLHPNALNFFSVTNFGKGALLETFSVSALALLHTTGKRS